MNRILSSTLSVALVAGLAACGDTPLGGTSSSPSGDTVPGASLQQLSFTGVVEPASGRFQIITGPQAAIGVITEDANGDPATATAATAQVYGATVDFALQGGAGYPAGCTGAQVMYSDVEVLSGFTEQLRNVYARMTQVSGGQTFCNTSAPGAIAPPASPLGLYFYQPLNAGAAPSALSRSVPWAINLADNGAFWFKGELWAEIIPNLPTIVRPLDGTSVSVGRGASGTVRFRWTNDPRADGGNSGETSYAVRRPTVRGALLTITRCGPAADAYDPVLCTGQVWGPTPYTNSRSQTLPKGYWFRWTLQTVFSLPGQGTATTTGTLISTNTFKTVT
jgi:hypothetical protein